ncbi:MAG: STAS domain-containing protein [Erysipelotrichaceae bacterium]|nr:STAS domain-containing protein [Erysipelotrichaceae bacterium]
MRGGKYMESKIKITSFDEGLVIKISGDLDSSKTFLYKEKIHQYMREYGPKYIIWDFKDLTFIDSAGIGLILGRFNEIERVKGIMGLIGLNSYSRKVIQISGLFSIMKEYSSLKAFMKEERITL